MTPRVTVSLVTWNGADFLPACLASLEAQTVPIEVRILDNGSTDTTRKLIEQWSPSLPVTKSFGETNRGFAAGHNALLADITTEYVLVLNQDIILEPQYIERLVAFADEHSEVGSVGGLLLLYEKKGSEIEKTAIIDDAGLQLYRTHRIVERCRGESLDRAPLGPAYVFGVSGAAPLYRRTALTQVAYRFAERQEFFNESFGSYKEDVELAYRLQLAGWGSGYVPAARGYHHRGLRGAADSHASTASASTVRHWRERSSRLSRLSYRNHLLFLMTCFPFAWFSREGLTTIVFEIGKVIFLVIWDRPSMKGLREAWQMRADARARRVQVFGHAVHIDRIVQWF